MLGLSALTRSRAPALTTLNLGLMAGNCAMHAGAALVQRRHNPGLVTATGVFLPFVVLGARRLERDPDVGGHLVGSGLAGGLLASAAMVALMRRRSQGTLPDVGGR